VAIQACRDGWTIEYRGHESGGSVSAARLVVAAGGGTSLTRSLTGRTNPVERWVAVLGRARHCDPAWQDDACLVVEKTMDGWMYGMPAPAGGAFVGVCVAGQLLSSGQNPIDLWRRTLSRSRLRGACRQGHDVWCCPMRGPVAADVAGDSWAIAGDAAQWVDPLSGLGVAFALESGRRAVEEPATYAAWVRAFRAQHDETRTALYGTQFSAV
jgi:flavin-dependent dehydrogenase